MKTRDLSKHFGKLTPVKVDSVSVVSSFEEDGKKYFIKRDGTGKRIEEAEVFSSFVLSKLNVKKFVKYEFGQVSSGNYSSVSESFITPDVKYQKSFFDMLMLYKYNGTLESEYSILEEMMLDQELVDENAGTHFNSVEFVNEVMLDVCKRQNIDYDADKNKRALNIMAICDYFMANEDRNMSNIEFLVKERNGKLYCELAPMFDFGYCFGVRIKSEKDESKSHTFVSSFGISESGQKREEFNSNKWFKNGLIIASDIRDLTKQDAEYADLVYKFLNLDIHSTVKEFEKEYVLRLPQNFREAIIDTFNERVNKYNIFQEMLNNRLKKNQEKTTQK